MNKSTLMNATISTCVLQSGRNALNKYGIITCYGCIRLLNSP